MDDKLDLKSLNISKDKIEQLKKVFPEVVTGGKVDIDKLKLALGEEIEVGKERYGMNWPGKANCFKIIQEPSIGTLKPVMEASVDFDTTENLFIEGDSLEVLKLLQKSYYEKVKMIYIDPPYNTGKDFIYPDNYTETLDTYLRYTGQKGESGLRLTTNAETEGRYHSKWMNMMYPRLFLARNLLKEDGVIFISIDDHEIDNLKKICNEIFGEENFVSQIAVINNFKGRNDKKNIAQAHEYLLIYQKTEFESYGVPLSDEQKAAFKYEDEKGRKYALRDLRKRGRPDRREDRPNMYFPIFFNPKSFKASPEQQSSDDIEILPKRGDNSDGRWRWGLAKVGKNLDILHPKYSKSKDRWDIEHRVYMDAPVDTSEDEDQDQDLSFEDAFLEISAKPKSFWYGGEISTDVGRRSLKVVLPEVEYDYPKPIDFIKKIINMGSKDKDIILDFFAGSCTSAQAILELNAKNQNNRKFIMIQLQEQIEKDTVNSTAGYKNIAEIGEERIRRVIKKIKEEDLEKAKEMDLGFKVFKLDQSNFKIWDKRSETSLHEQLQISVNNINDGSTYEEILYEIILKAGFELTASVDKLNIQGKTIYSVDDKSLLICLESSLTQDFMKELAGLEAGRVICLDRGFDGNDQLKANSVEFMKVKGVEFKTI